MLHPQAPGEVAHQPHDLGPIPARLGERQDPHVAEPIADEVAPRPRPRTAIRNAPPGFHFLDGWSARGPWDRSTLRDSASYPNE